MFKRLIRIAAFALIAFALYSLFTQSNLTVGAYWAKADFKSLQTTQSVVEQYIAMWLWNPVMASILLTPLWVVSGVLGAIFLPFGLKKVQSDV